MNKKGFVQDFLLIAVVLFTLAIIIVVTLKWGTAINDKFQASDMNQDGKDILDNVITRYSTVWDYAFLTALVFLLIAIMVTMFTTSAHPGFYWIAVIVIGIMLVPLAILSNAYGDFAASPYIAVQAAQFDIINWALDNWAIIFGAVGLGSLALLFAVMRK